MNLKNGDKHVQYRIHIICIFFVLCTGHHTLSTAVSVQQYASSTHNAKMQSLGCTGPSLIWYYVKKHWLEKAT